MNYKDLVDSLRRGREIEFSYKNVNYSITNYEGIWYFSEEKDGMVKSQKLSNFEDYDNLIKNVNKITMQEKTIKHLFDNKEYEEGTLYIL
ncbi:hypothetical protein JNO63_08100 [Anaerococcus sp. mt242]|uniref:hypothetical protein n=1 Tax=Anaerococcus sp. mt242 TaxID=2661917 RepID=UPI00193364F6|nr:hypothetical protein [Anaerococcus sp. mt242]MBM0047055.1 hypothetical protein [Anaerococcus sp. mt242]